MAVQTRNLIFHKPLNEAAVASSEFLPLFFFQEMKEKVLEADRIRFHVWLSITLKTTLIHLDVTEQWLI